MSANVALIRAGLRTLRGLTLAAGVASAAGCGAVLDLAEGDAPPRKSFSWHAGPRAHCGTFGVTELTVLRRLNEDERHASEERYYLSFDGGAAHNVTSRISIGGSLFAGGDGSDRTHFGLRGRLRYWLGKSASVDLAPGLILFGHEEDNKELVTPAPILRVGVNPSASFGIAYQIFETKRRDTHGEVKERGSYVGAQLGSAAGLAGTGVVLAASVIFIALVLSSL
ncbi:MAG TPA: hypothetical protein VFR25_06755 [Candidatus Eisenbacteria bacterium]|nr:hypothetical protein [Candidatus Eisenbacteria bacterium]